MELWFLRDPTRFYQERGDVVALSKRSSWLIEYGWGFGTDGLGLDAVIRAHDHNYEVRVSFPSLFPHAPIAVRPRHEDERLSQHQYGGADGPLCLEFGPDNWHQGITAAQMLESAYRLFDIENPRGRGPDTPAIVAPSRHQLTVGQELRRAFARWYCTPEFEAFISSKANVGSLKFSFRRVANGEWIILLHDAATFDGENWSDPLIPKDIPQARRADLYSGMWFSTDAPSSEISNAERVDAISAMLPSGSDPKLFARDGTSPVEGMQKWIAGALIRTNDGELHFSLILDDGGLIQCVRVLSGLQAKTARAPQQIQLAGKQIGIVGLGSAGSKVAVSLARMGARRFFLADHDIFLPENLARHALDWQSVGRHKSDAVATALAYIAADVEVQTSQLHLTGQENNALIGGVLDRLAACDLIIDATASARVFNLLAATAHAANRPLTWFEVFAGGIGGLIARSRPGVDADAQRMRLSYLQFCKDNPPPESMRAAIDYGVEDPSGNVLTASDADVSVVAHLAASLAVDSLAESQSKYPQSMYLVGLARGWVFEQPFDTRPLATPPATATSDPDRERHEADNDTFLLEILKKKSDS